MGLAITPREFWNLVHLGIGALFLHTFVEGILGLLNSERGRRLTYGAIGMAVAAWVTVISGTWLVYPGYRAKPPAGANLLDYPQRYLLADSQLAGWHNFGMEWKEHAGWITPMLATAVAFIVLRYGDRLRHDERLRKTLLGVFVAAFALAIVSGTLGAFISKVAPNTFLDLG
jgi:uncharacterized membrane protein